MTGSLAPKRRPSARKYLTPAAEQIIAACYPGQALAAVVERAVRQMAIRDGLLPPKTGRPRAGRGDP
ncbi:hypothetical protein [Streptomyces sp. NPDC086519]|uniref:hypothetical protein n=1 Tax=Streptomyces sp. NPDC086519 TaxID=3154863 RepID=UPI0034261244